MSWRKIMQLKRAGSVDLHCSPGVPVLNEILKPRANLNKWESGISVHSISNPATHRALSQSLRECSRQWHGIAMEAERLLFQTVIWFKSVQWLLLPFLSLPCQTVTADVEGGGLLHTTYNCVISLLPKGERWQTGQSASHFPPVGL